MQIAITRPPSATLGNCELTHLPRQRIDVAAARREHRAYEDALRGLGLQIVSLPARDAWPDAAFVEDVAVVLDEVAILTRLGAASREPEAASVAEALATSRRLERLEAGRLEGGDVLRVDRTLYVGVSSRSDLAGAAALRASAGRYGYDVRFVEVRGCLHLKTACTYLGENTLLVNPRWIDAGALAGHAAIHVDPGEEFAANTLRIGATLLVAAGFPATRARLETAGFRCLELPLAELAKAEAGLTCLSLIFEAERTPEPPAPGSG